jgi:hypothetical protein
MPRPTPGGHAGERRSPLRAPQAQRRSAQLRISAEAVILRQNHGWMRVDLTSSFYDAPERGAGTIARSMF